uniref:Uncharacterized protein n=1 Tax=Ascaris lumbricoides TaxID=6252 RepID=A0A0M3ISV5_ASCLU
MGAGQQSRIHCTRLAGEKAASWEEGDEEFQTKKGVKGCQRVVSSASSSPKCEPRDVIRASLMYRVGNVFFACRWMRQYDRVLALPWKPTVRRSDKSNAIDVMVSGVLGSETPAEHWNSHF